MRIADATKVYKGGATVSKIYKGATQVYPSASSAIVAPNTFTLSAAATTSAGVYATDGTLVRTLWSGVKKDAGTYPILWDGTDDFQNPISAGSYTVKVLSNNVTYTWEGAVIGNTSSALTGETKYRGNDSFTSMVFVGSKGYAALGYMEGHSPYISFSLSNPQSKTNLFDGHVNQTPLFSATDGVKIYWAVQDSYSEETHFVFATKVTDDSEYTFSSGVPYHITYGNQYNSVVSLNSTAGTGITGVAVQKNGNYLFVARKGINQLSVLNKLTGAVVQTITVSSPRYMAIDSSDNLWIVSATNTVGKYIVSTSGTIGSPVISLQGLVSPLAVSVSPDGATVLVADGGTSQQLKAYGNSTGGLSWTYGQAGGYRNSALVADDKFFFTNATGDMDKTFVSYQPDGSFWVNDTGNYRARHFSAARIFIEEIMFLPTMYSANADTTTPTRVLANYLEFAIDYSKPLAPTNGSWKLVKSWEGSAPVSLLLNNFANILHNVTTLSNGRTYASLSDTLVELGANNKIRDTGQILDGRHLYPDGTLRWYNTVNNVMTWYSVSLSQFDSSGNPIWGNEVIMNTSSYQEPLPGSPFETPVPLTSSGITIAFDSGGSDTYALGGIKNNKWLWKTAQVTHANYQGDFPNNGWFDMGNGNVPYRGNIARAMDRHIIWGYNGEFWKNSETNKFNHVYDNGLFVGQFGTTGPEAGGAGGAMMAGNSFSPSLVKVGADYYLYHNDESYHGAVHRWKISGINTIQEQTIPLTSSFVIQSEATVLAGVDLMAGLPFDTILPASVAGWTRNPVESGIWNISTSVKTYDKRKPTDISVVYSNDVAGVYTLSRDLVNSAVLSNWELKGNIRYDGNMGNTGTIFMYMDILDNAAKIISRFYTTVNFDNGYMDTIWANNTQIGITDQYETYGINSFQPISFKLSAGVVTVKYGSYLPVNIGAYDSGANIGFPKTLRLFFNYNNDGGPNYGKHIDLSEMRFIAS